MKKLWVTYPWKDNEALDVDFIIQELEKVGVDVRYDRRQLMTGQPLWPQIDQQITNPANSDAWALVVSRRSLESGPCREELNYALDRALSARGQQYPLIGIFVEEIEKALIPTAIRSRLYVNTESSDWLERVRSGVHQVVPTITGAHVAPEFIKIHRAGSYPVIVEARPRSGIWNPLVAMVPAAEKGLLEAVIVRPAGKVPPLEGYSYVEGNWPGDRRLWVRGPERDICATPTMSMYVFLHAEPTRLLLGPEDRPVEVDLAK